MVGIPPKRSVLSRAGGLFNHYTKTMSKVVHYQPNPKNPNARCLTGDGHRKMSQDLQEVTCEKCLKPETYYKGYWKHDEELSMIGCVSKSF